MDERKLPQAQLRQDGAHLLRKFHLSLGRLLVAHIPQRTPCTDRECPQLRNHPRLLPIHDPPGKLCCLLLLAHTPQTPEDLQMDPSRLLQDSHPRLSHEQARLRQSSLLRHLN
ncbi:hypothetical protein NDU88_004870 [Pleurodeles waltl]|uniref:Uncharacterized protein n=1 Tax=Pleurodeles waltl TaxID=8319 RepID=A0AAV7NNJ7_PLEWA|nr:hypothetical protein NDU88_004870 [Pleurodeles waltl]